MKLFFGIEKEKKIFCGFLKEQKEMIDDKLGDIFQRRE